MELGVLIIHFIINNVYLSDFIKYFNKNTSKFLNNEAFIQIKVSLIIIPTLTLNTRTGNYDYNNT